LKFNRDHIVGLVCIAIAIAVLLVTPSFPAGTDESKYTGPAFFPNVLAVLYLALGLYELILGFINAFKERNGKQGTTEKDRIKLDGKSVRSTVLYVVLLVGFVVFFDILGFIVTSLVFLFLLMVLLGVTPIKSLIFSFFFVAMIYLLFGKLFTIGLPAGILGFLEL
jgi:small-conductance mechanosensitive channel